MIRDIVGMLGIVAGLVILAVRMTKGVATEPTFDVVFWSTLSLGVGFGVLFALDVKILGWVIDKACDIVGAPDEWSPPDFKGQIKEKIRRVRDSIALFLRRYGLHEGTHTRRSS